MNFQMTEKYRALLVPATRHPVGHGMSYLAYLHKHRAVACSRYVAACLTEVFDQQISARGLAEARYRSWLPVLDIKFPGKVSLRGIVLVNPAGKPVALAIRRPRRHRVIVQIEQPLCLVTTRRTRTHPPSTYIVWEDGTSARYSGGKVGAVAVRTTFLRPDQFKAAHAAFREGGRIPLQLPLANSSPLQLGFFGTTDTAEIKVRGGYIVVPRLVAHQLGKPVEQIVQFHQRGGESAD